MKQKLKQFCMECGLKPSYDGSHLIVKGYGPGYFYIRIGLDDIVSIYLEKGHIRNYEELKTNLLIEEDNLINKIVHIIINFFGFTPHIFIEYIRHIRDEKIGEILK